MKLTKVDEQKGCGAVALMVISAMTIIEAGERADKHQWWSAAAFFLVSTGILAFLMLALR